MLAHPVGLPPVGDGLRDVSLSRLLRFRLELRACRIHINETVYKEMYREIQLDLHPEIEVLNSLFEKCHTINRKVYLKQYIKYFNFRS